ncbi:2OG-Fe(II) oxygenase [Rhodococcus sp. NPDC003382]|uniref:2OG-Fe(II) oxygenase n=1 Tax=Rhodococcus sp. CX TaxID=2789880 RepID=UPI0018CFD2BE|nr:2OG-Fe(II) oxygenase [Rhodococcus sp. CX]MBH0123379.1 2OG-Fe(II) oxygenase [Rhodococcus sp. CX]
MIDTAVTLRPGTVTCVDEFLDAGECALIGDDLRFTYWRPSSVLRRDAEGRRFTGLSIDRTSSTTDETWLSDEARELLRRVEARLAADFGVPADRFEPWQIVRYRAGERFEEHHDSGFFSGDRWGERSVSVLIYLSDSQSGGSTWFPVLRERFRPRAGRLLAWPNLLPDGSVDQRMRHTARPARRVKTILTTWVREAPTTTNPAE